MIAQYIQLGNKGWNVLVYYNAGVGDYLEIEESLDQLDCPEADKRKALNTLRKLNTGFTFTNDAYKMSIVCISKAEDVGQFVNTVIHEAKHVQSHVCQYYNIEEDTETAAYLIGHLVHQMYKMLAKILRQYV